MLPRTTVRAARASELRLRIKALTLLAFCFVFATQSQRAQERVHGTFSAPEVRLNEPTSSVVGTRPTVIPLGQTKVIVLWEDNRNEVAFQQHTIFAQKLNYPELLSENLALTLPDAFSTQPDAVVLKLQNEILLSWQEYTRTLQHSNILTQVFDTSLVQKGAPFFASRDSMRYPVRPRIAACDSIFALVWQESAERQASMLRLFSTNTSPRTDTIRQNSGLVQNALLPSVAVRSDGSVFSAWIDKGASKRGVMLRSYSAQGTSMSIPRRLNEFTDDRQITKPEMIALQNGHVLCAWADARAGEWNVYAQFIDSDGLVYGGNIPVSNDLKPITLSAVSLASSSGRILLVWEAMRDGQITIAGQWLRLDGSFLGSNAYLLDEGPWDGKIPHVAFTDGAAYLAWNDNRFSDQPNQFDVFVKKIDVPADPSAVAFADVEHSFKLHQNYPNPFSTSTTIRIDAHPSIVNGQLASLKLYDMMGREVNDLSHRLHAMSAFTHSITLQASDFPQSGLYVYQMRARGRVESRMMSVVKR